VNEHEQTMKNYISLTKIWCSLLCQQMHKGIAYVLFGGTLWCVFFLLKLHPFSRLIMIYRFFIQIMAFTFI